VVADECCVNGDESGTVSEYSMPISLLCIYIYIYISAQDVPNDITPMA